MSLEELSRQDLIRLVQMYAKNWLAHDGCWFLAAEEKLGLDQAIALDAHAWKCFSPVEARRIMEQFDIAAGGGIDALEKALRYRLYATVSVQDTARLPAERLRFRMIECRVQQARRRKGLAPFPCKSVGLVEYTQFALAVDPRLQTLCKHAPPDPVTDCFCEWEFYVAAPTGAR